MKKFSELVLIAAPLFLLLPSSSLSIFANAKAASQPSAPVSGASPSGQTIYRAEDFLDFLGVNVNMLAPSYRYNVNAVASDLSYTGLKHVRGTIGAFSTTKPYYTSDTWVTPISGSVAGTPVDGGAQGLHAITSVQMAQMLSAVGSRPDVMIYMEDPKKYQSWLDANVDELEYIEGPNEVDLYPSTASYNGLSKIAGGAAVQQALYTMLKSDPKLASLPIYAMTIGRPSAENLTSAGDIGSYADFGNVHAYAGIGRPPYSALKKALIVTGDVPGKPFVLTETGYPTAVYNAMIDKATASGSNIVSENDQARYILDATFDAFNLGYTKAYIFMLIDTQCDPNYTNAEMHFGIFSCENRPKSAAVGLHNLHDILQDTGASASSFTPAALSFTLSQALTDPAHDVNTFHTLLEKANGTYDLVLWGEPTLWNHGRHSDISMSVPTNSVEISFKTPYKSIKIFDPMVGLSPVQKLANTSQVNVSIVDHPVIVEIESNQD